MWLSYSSTRLGSWLNTPDPDANWITSQESNETSQEEYWQTNVPWPENYLQKL